MFPLPAPGRVAHGGNAGGPAGIDGVKNRSTPLPIPAIPTALLAPPGTAFFPDTDPNQVVVELEAPAGTRLDPTTIMYKSL